jgi:hypothetical protein
VKTTRRDFIAGVVAAAAMPATAGTTVPAWPYDVSGGLVDVIDGAMRYNAELLVQNQHQQFHTFLRNRDDVSERWALFEWWGSEYVEMRPASLGYLLQWLVDAARRNWLYEKIAQEAYGKYSAEPLDGEARRRLLSEADNAGRPTVFYFEHRQTGERVPLTGRWLYEFYSRAKAKTQRS